MTTRNGIYEDTRTRTLWSAGMDDVGNPIVTTSDDPATTARLGDLRRALRHPSLSERLIALAAADFVPRYDLEHDPRIHSLIFARLQAERAAARLRALAVEVANGSQPMAAVAAGAGITRQTLYAWRSQALEATPVADSPADVDTPPMF